MEGALRTQDNKYVQMDLSKLCHGSYLMCASTVPVTPGKVRQDREGLQIMGSFQGYNMWRYSQQDLFDSGLGGGKASRARAPTNGEEESGHNFTFWLFLFYVFALFSPFLSWPLASMCCSFCAFLRNRGCD